MDISETHTGSRRYGQIDLASVSNTLPSAEPQLNPTEILVAAASETKPASRAVTCLQELIDNGHTEALEAGVKIGAKFLQDLKGPLLEGAESDRSEADHWFKTVTALVDSVQATRTIVGVVGNTGAGKSSVINALLDEERCFDS